MVGTKQGGADVRTRGRGNDSAALDTLGRACDATKDIDCARNAYGKLVKLPAGGTDKAAVEHAKLRMKILKPSRKSARMSARKHRR